MFVAPIQGEIWIVKVGPYPSNAKIESFNVKYDEINAFFMENS